MEVPQLQLNASNHRILHVGRSLALFFYGIRSGLADSLRWFFFVSNRVIFAYLC
jgi:hypothetical protein